MLKETGNDVLVDMFYKSKNWGLPFAPLGWADHPMYIIDALTICGNEYNAMKRENDGN